MGRLMCIVGFSSYFYIVTKKRHLIMVMFRTLTWAKLFTNFKNCLNLTLLFMIWGFDAFFDASNAN